MPSNYVRFWGVRGSYPTPFATHLKYGGNTTCLEIRAGNHLAVIDGGSGIIPLGEQLMAQSDIKHMVLAFTHYHWDHISGMPFFIPAYVPNWTIDVYGPGKTPADVEFQLSQQMKDPFFPVEIGTSWHARINYKDTEGDLIKHGPITLQRFVVHHPGTTFGYRIEVNGKSVVFVPDQELLFIDDTIDKRVQDDSIDEEEKALLQQMKDEEKWKLLGPLLDTDHLIHDAQYTPKDYDMKRGWGHSCFIDTVNCAIDARARHLHLFHHDPSYNDEALEALHAQALDVIKARDSDMPCDLATEGKILSLD